MWPFGRKKNKPSPEGINLLGSILLCYGEIATVSYEPENQTFKFSFTFNTPLTEKEFQDQAHFLGESLETYQMLEGLVGCHIEFSLEAQGKLAFFHVIRDLVTVTRGEIDLLVTLMRERFGERLLCDEHSSGMDPDFAAAQMELLDRNLMGLQEARPKDHLVGLREEDHVVVYNR
ncbi:MAG: hypothetical protein IJ849_12345 [Selenomonadaceae bacterium]|nr:hypothetical protein [Selenomonadaceae bacterium]